MPVRFTYPFITDLVSAMLIRAGASLRDSMFIENFIVGVAFVGVIHRWALQLLRDRLAAVITPVLILLNGGFGWLKFLWDAWLSGDLYASLARLPHSYTIIPETTWRWGNAMTSLLVTQRGFLLGIPLAVIVFTQWWISLENAKGKSKKEKGKKKKPHGRERNTRLSAESELSPSVFPFSFFLFPSAKRMIAAGIVAGLLPLIHAHTFAVVMGIGGCIALMQWRRWRDWMAFFLVALLVALPQMWWSTRGSAVSAGSFMGFNFGWDNAEANAFLTLAWASFKGGDVYGLGLLLQSLQTFVWFWFKNTGLFIPLLIVALVWKRGDRLVSRRLLLFYLPFTLCFLIPNLFKMAPWIWDNIKVLFYWWIASAPIVALAIARLWQGGISRRILAAGLFAALTMAGGLDVFALVTNQQEYREFDRDGIDLAQMIRQLTPRRAIVLHAPIHNDPVFLTGRRSLMGYPGHIWTHGIEYRAREADIRRIYAGGPDAARLLAKYGVEYVVVSPLESSVFPVNELFFRQYTKVGETGGYRLYKITP